MAINEQSLEKALREAADWKARAVAAQAAAESMRQKAQALKDGAQQALRGSKDLQAALHRARAEILALQTQQKELSQTKGEVEEALLASQKERESAQSTLSSVQQQLALYVAALEESRQGSDLEGIRSALRAVLENPSVEEQLREQLWQARAENHGLKLAFERCQTDLLTLENELRSKDETLEDKEREYFALYGELDLTKSLIQEMRRGEENSERLQQQHQSSLEVLAEKEAAMATLQSEMASLLAASQQLTESHREKVENLLAENLELQGRLQTDEKSRDHTDELESLKATIVLLEDQISDLEIVNSDLYQKLTDLEVP